MELKNIRKIDCEIEALLFEQENIRNQMEGLTGIRYDTPKVQGSGGGRNIDDLLHELESLWNKINHRLLDLTKEKKEALKIIEQIKDTRYRIVLVERYINSKSWKEIEESIGYTEQHVRRLHMAALSEFEEIKKMC